MICGVPVFSSAAYCCRDGDILVHNDGSFAMVTVWKTDLFIHSELTLDCAYLLGTNVCFCSHYQISLQAKNMLIFLYQRELDG